MASDVIERLKASA